MEIVAVAGSASRKVNEAGSLARYPTDGLVLAQRLQSTGGETATTDTTTTTLDS